MDQIEKKILSIIDDNREKIIEYGRSIWAYPELGYKEFKTSEKFLDLMNELGIPTTTDLAITGAKGYLKGMDAKGRNVAIIGELDALPIKDGPYSNQETGASHSCGHNAQMAGMMGSALALADPEVREALDGNVTFFAVPSEEFVEIEFKNGLMKDGKIGYGGGKSELIRIGAFDDIDIAVGHHIMPGSEIAISNHRSNGFVNKIVKYNGVSSHAAEAPFNGVDAVSAASLAQTALNFQRESFRDKDTVRVHGFISSGGEAMNVIADKSVMEFSVRANNIPAILDADKKFDRAMRAGAVGTGCGMEIITMPGYLPMVPMDDTRAIDEAMADVASQYDYHVQPDPGCLQGGSTDLGDVSQLLPTLCFNTGGYDRTLHDKCMHPIDEELAYIVTAKVFALTAYKLLRNGGEYAEEIKKNHRPNMTKEEYIEYMEARNTVETMEMEIQRVQE